MCDLVVTAMSPNCAELCCAVVFLSSPLSPSPPLPLLSLPLLSPSPLSPSPSPPICPSSNYIKWAVQDAECSGSKFTAGTAALQLPVSGLGPQGPPAQGGCPGTEPAAIARYS